MDTSSVRATFLDFFRERDHTIVPSSSLVPDDPTLLFTNSGMVQFKPYFEGVKRSPYTRAASAQKILRAGGKHNDLEEVGKTSRHFTFFEMLGNFSFGDYFKLDACRWGWELLTQVYGLDPSRFWATIYVDDEEVGKIWEDEIGLPIGRIIPLTKEQGNFWDMGVAGPCGYNSELLYDRGQSFGADYSGSGEPAGERYIEVWNLVFMQFLQNDAGEVLGELPERNVDTGMGFERLVMLLQDVPTIFDIDTMSSLLDAASSVVGGAYGQDPDHDVNLRVMAEHSRAISFLIGDGVLPSNEARGYVVRRLIRRAARFARKAGFDKPFLTVLTEVVVDTFGDVYPELVRNRDLIDKVVRREETRFTTTLRQGLVMLETEIEAAKRQGRERLSGETIFKLHDTYGFPLDMATEIAGEEGLIVDSSEFESHMKVQRERARSARKTGSVMPAGHAALGQVLEAKGKTEFLGYEKSVLDSQVVALLIGLESVATLTEGQEGQVVLSSTVFYAEGGGQVGDRGEIRTAGGTFEVTDTRWGVPGVIVHKGQVTSGEINIQDAAAIAVNAAHREGVHQSHTATHIVHWALRDALGEHARQQGSLVEAGRLRFDFSHYEALEADAVARLEEAVNRLVLLDDPVRAFETTYDFAIESGAMALFGEKYGDIVRMVEVGEYSKELCGGTHAARTGRVGVIKILHEGSVAAGVRRVEALTGMAGLDYLNQQVMKLRQVAVVLKSDPEQVLDKVEKLLQTTRSWEQQIAKQREQERKGDLREILASAAVTDVGASRLVVLRRDGETVDDLRKLTIALRDCIGSGIVLVGAVGDGRANVLAAVTRDLVDKGISSNELVSIGAPLLGGRGGGKPDLALGGGPDGSKADAAIGLMQARARDLLEKV